MSTVAPAQAATSPAAGQFALLLVPILSGIAIGALSPILSQMSAHFASTPGAEPLVRAMITGAGAAMIVGAPAGGFLSERLGERAVLIGALLLFAVAGTAGAVFDNIWLLLASRIVLGLAVAAAGVMALTLLTRLVPDGQRDRWIGFYTLTGSIGMILLIPLAGMLGSINWRLVFLLHLVALLILIPIALKTRGLAPAAHERSAAVGGGFPVKLLLLGLACGAVSTTQAAYLPFHLQSLGEVDPASISLPMTSAAVASALMALGYGWIRQRLGEGQIFLLAFLATGAGIAGAAASVSLAGVTVAIFVAGIGIGLLAPVLFSVAAEGDPVRRARRIGFARAGFFGAPLLAQIPLEPLALSLGAAGALYAIAGFAVVMIGVMLTSRRGPLFAGTGS